MRLIAPCNVQSRTKGCLTKRFCDHEDGPALHRGRSSFWASRLRADRNYRSFATNMKITWMLTHKVVPGTREPPSPDFTAFDGEEAIGRVHQIVDGPERGLWSWTMTAVRGGPTPTFPTAGRVAERAKAGRCVAEAYRAMLESSWKSRVRPEG